MDGKKYTLNPWPQRFCTDKKGTCFVEEYFTSIFGPVIDSRYDPVIEKNDRLAVMWTGFLTDNHDGMAYSFTKMAGSSNVAEAQNAVKLMSLPGINIILADTAGDIGFAYGGLVPKKDLSQNQYLPLDGAKHASLWNGVLPAALKPAAINPAEGFIVNANQNIYESTDSRKHDFGKLGAPPYRALRIREVIEELKAKNDLLFLSFRIFSSIPFLWKLAVWHHAWALLLHGAL